MAGLSAREIRNQVPYLNSGALFSAMRAKIAVAREML